MIVSAQTLRHRKPVSPFVERGIAFGMSYGLAQCGYDIRLAHDLVLWPRSTRLASAYEHFTMPNDMQAGVYDKSTWARRKVYVHNTRIEPGWCGYLTLEIANEGYRFWFLRVGMPIAQIVWHFLDVPTETPYNGKYQNQAAGPQRARMEMERDDCAY